MWQCYEGGDLSPLQPAWEAAYAAAPATIFQSFPFARRWAESFADLARIRVWLDRSGSSAPVVLPTAARGSRLSLLGEGMFDYLALVGPAPPRQQIEAAELILQEGWSELLVTGARARDRQERFWLGLGASAEPYSAAPRRPPVAGPGSDPVRILETEHARLCSRFRRAEREGCRLLPVTEPRERLALLEWMLERKQQHCLERGLANVLGPAESRWLRRMVEFEPGLAELWSWQDGAGPLSALLCWRDSTMRHAYTIACGSRALERSPGVLLLFGLVRRTMEEGCTFDFLTGEQAFKCRLATHREPLLRFRARRESAPGSASRQPMDRECFQKTA